VIVKVVEACAVGVPLSKPEPDRVRPAGRVDPDFTANAVVFDATSCTEYATPTATSARPAAVVHVGDELVVTVNARSAKIVEDVALRARTVKLYVANALGVPLRTPPALRAVPAGSAPATTEYPVAEALVATNVVLNDTNAAVFGSAGAVVQVGVVATSSVNARSTTAFAAPPVALTVNENEPAAESVPLSRPPADSDEPVGRAPACSA
jgi:hypothetical protein